jgi:hypothetical protein
MREIFVRILLIVLFFSPTESLQTVYADNETQTGKIGSIKDVDSFPYPSFDAEFNRFDDWEPIWHISANVLAFQRFYRDLADRKIHVYNPLDENGTVVPLTEPSASWARRRGNYLPAEFVWLPTNHATKFSPESIDGAGIYRFLYTESGNIYQGELEFSKAKLKNRPFIAVEKDGKFVHSHSADYSTNAELVIYQSGLTGIVDLYTKHILSPAEDVGMCLIDNNFGDFGPKWSPDGKQIAYFSDYEPENAPGSFDIFLLRNATSPKREQIRLTTSPLDESSPVWSPDGEFLAYYTVRREGDETVRREGDESEQEVFDSLDESNHDISGKRIYELWIVQPNNPDPQPRRIAEDVHGQERGPTWVKSEELDEQHLIYIAEGRTSIFVKTVEQEVIEPYRIEGLAGKKRIISLDCRKHNRFNRLLLAYSAVNPAGKQRIYVEVLLYRKPIKPFDVELRYETDLRSGDNSISSDFRAVMKKNGVEFSEDIEIQSEENTKWIVTDNASKQMFVFTKNGSKLTVSNSWYIKESIIPGERK